MAILNKDGELDPTTTRRTSKSMNGVSWKIMIPHLRHLADINHFGIFKSLKMVIKEAMGSDVMSAAKKRITTVPHAQPQSDKPSLFVVNAFVETLENHVNTIMKQIPNLLIKKIDYR